MKDDLIKFFVRISASFAFGLFVYLIMLCNPKGSNRNCFLLFSNPTEFFNSFDPYYGHFQINFCIMYGVLAGILLFLFWKDQ
jgi:hypothetical protein